MQPANAATQQRGAQPLAAAVNGPVRPQTSTAHKKIGPPVPKRLRPPPPAQRRGEHVGAVPERGPAPASTATTRHLAPLTASESHDGTAEERPARSQGTEGSPSQPSVAERTSSGRAAVPSSKRGSGVFGTSSGSASPLSAAQVAAMRQSIASRSQRRDRSRRNGAPYDGNADEDEDEDEDDDDDDDAPRVFVVPSDLQFVHRVTSTSRGDSISRLPSDGHSRAPPPDHRQSDGNDGSTSTSPQRRHHHSHSEEGVDASPSPLRPSPMSLRRMQSVTEHDAALQAAQLQFERLQTFAVELLVEGRQEEYNDARRQLDHMQYSLPSLLTALRRHQRRSVGSIESNGGDGEEDMPTETMSVEQYHALVDEL